WKVDLEHTVSLKRILLHFWDGVQQVELEISDDDETYHSVGTIDVKEMQTDFTLPENTTGRYIKVTITEASSNWIGFMKFEAYGSDDIDMTDDIPPVTDINIEGTLENGSYIDYV